MASIYGPPGSEVLDTKTGKWFGIGSLEEAESVQDIYCLRRSAVG